LKYNTKGAMISMKLFGTVQKSFTKRRFWPVPKSFKGD